MFSNTSEQGTPSFSLRSEMKRNGSEIFFRFFRIDAKRRNLKRNENEMKRKQNEKGAKTAVIFASKRNRSDISFASMRKSAFLLVFTSDAKKNEMLAKTK
jgi:hypothetical protein